MLLLSAFVGLTMAAGVKRFEYSHSFKAPFFLGATVVCLLTRSPAIFVAHLLCVVCIVRGCSCVRACVYVRARACEWWRLFWRPSADVVVFFCSRRRAVRGTDLPFWDYGGSTVISQETIRLTPPEADRVGFLWNQKVRRAYARAACSPRVFFFVLLFFVLFGSRTHAAQASSDARGDAT